MLRGNALAKIDEKGRLKLPSVFRAVIEPRYGTEFFVTSIRGDSARVYPMPVFASMEERLLKTSSIEPLATRLRRAINYYGQTSVMDAQGRLLIHPLLRESARIDGEVAVIGAQDHLEIWNRTAFEKLLKGAPLTDAELEKLASYGI